MRSHFCRYVFIYEMRMINVRDNCQQGVHLSTMWRPERSNLYFVILHYPSYTMVTSQRNKKNIYFYIVKFCDPNLTSNTFVSLATPGHITIAETIINHSYAMKTLFITPVNRRRFRRMTQQWDKLVQSTHRSINYQP